MTRPAQAEPDAAAPESPLWESERIVSDTVGRLMAVWGFKRNMGRVWSVLYLAAEPLSAAQLRERLRLSAGAVSMTLSELARWGVVHKRWVAGDRRDFYEAEANVWKMVSRVMRERERTEIVQAIEAFEEALVVLDHLVADGEVRNGERVRIQRERIQKLLELARLGRSMLDALISSARLDASWLTRFRLGRSAD
ncbi:MAG: ArsR family transcriptional regulator [Myxococcales bacterium]|nr:ArsR family transcriptional regulator [Myxococcales bacterium]